MRTKAEIESQFGDRYILDQAQNLYLIGIGGAGMSALAFLALEQGLNVSGCDAAESTVLQNLRNRGIEVITPSSGEDPGLPKGVDAIVVSDAIDLQADPIVKQARINDIPIFRRSQLLGSLLRNHRLIAVTGTHGKTTTTALVAFGLEGAGLDPLAVEGATIPAWNGPLLIGKGKWAVAEACEAYDGIHDLNPEIILLTNLELDHQDFHGNYDALEASILRFVNKLGRDGILIFNAEDKGASKIAELAMCLKFGYRESDFVEDLCLFGSHNRSNAAGAKLALAKVLERECLPLDRLARGVETMSSFGGAERRLQEIYNGLITIIDDYAHTPTEIAASIYALRTKYSDKRIVVVYQPHLYSRTQGAEKLFAEALSLADCVVLTDIYPAREAPVPGVSSAVIEGQISTETYYVPSRHLLPRKVAALLNLGDVVVGMGAGSISQFPPQLVEEIQRFGIGIQRKPRFLGRPLKVVVIYGGDSSEREVSLHSGLAIRAALIRKGFCVDIIDLSESLLLHGTVESLTGSTRPDVVFLATHGVRAEDGALQGLMELLHLPYTGSGIQSSALAMDKSMAKKVLKLAGIQVPKDITLTSKDELSTASILKQIPLPLVIKPNAEGSTVGVSFIKVEDEIIAGLERAFAYGNEVLIEERIIGMEVSTPVLCGEALLPVEIAPATGIYDFSSKYTPGATEEIVPARLPKKELEMCQTIALKAHQCLRCEGATRTDMIVRNGEVIVLELNTLPGMTFTSLLPKSSEASGIPFDDLCVKIALDALDRYAQKV